MLRIEKAVLAGIIITFALVMCDFSAQRDDISDKILRLHVIANSDELADQELKIQVRDRILREGAAGFSGQTDKAAVAREVEQRIPELTRAAQDEIQKQGYDYPVTLQMEKTHFDTRVYNDVTLPAGVYDALRVVIGTGEGQNWWCVMFPPMCLPAAEETQALSDVLTEGELQTVEGGKKFEIRFKTLEVYEEFLRWVRGE